MNKLGVGLLVFLFYTTFCLVLARDPNEVDGEWKQIKKPWFTSWPGPRAFLASISISDDQMFFVGGLSGKSVENLKDSWILTTKLKFKQMADLPINSSGITEHSIVMYDDNLYVYGGTWTEAYLGGRNELWRYSLSSNAWNLESSGGGNRTGHLAWIYDSKMFVHGSDSDDVFSDTLESYDFNSKKWDTLSLTNAPKLRMYNHNGMMINSTHMFIFGGEFPFSENNGSSAVINMETLEWTYIDTGYPSPTGRYNYAFVKAKNCNKYLIYGGESDEGGLNDFWALDCRSNDGCTWQNIPRDKIWPANMAGTAYSFIGDSMILFSGCDLEGFCNYPDDVWKFSIASC